MSNQQRFLRTIDGYEQVVAKVLAVLVCAVVAAASLQLIASVGMRVINPSTDWLNGELMVLLDRLLLILIALEVLQNLTAYLREHVVQIELVLITALTAVARKVIVMPQHSDGQPWMLASLGFTVLTLAGAYWLVRWTLRQQPPQGLQ
ncbi:MAG: hypothetical protein RLZZ533_1776 [Cyanobacteriota bacterium]